jgi:hypothetical protein
MSARRSVVGGEMLSVGALERVYWQTGRGDDYSMSPRTSLLAGVMTILCPLERVYWLAGVMISLCLLERVCGGIFHDTATRLGAVPVVK